MSVILLTWLCEDAMVDTGKAGTKRLDTKAYRREMKFLCEERQLRLIEDRIRHICRPDTYAEETGSYLVRSLYFDTYDDRCYHENLAGVDRRRKYRIRVYNDDRDRLKLECKYSYRGRKAKEVCPIDGRQYREIIEGEGFRKSFEALGPKGPDKENPEGAELLRRFLAERRTELLEPKAVVEYVRTPYVYEAGNVRITFDRAIRTSCRIRSFPERGKICRSILPEGVHVLEVKYDEVFPAAVRELLTAGQDLRSTSFSKYALCRQYGYR